MEWITEPERQIKVVADVDLLVCGGGFAGVAAALYAARNGANVLLLERYGFLGGLCTAALVIDTTGDADIAAYSDAPFRLIKKPMTMMFNMVGVDVEKALGTFGSWSNLKKVVKEAMDKGELPFDLGFNPEFGAPGVHAEELVYDGQLNVWSGMLLDMSGIDPRDLTRAEFITREHVMRLAAFLKKNIPGFDKSRIEHTATQVGVRASRQIIGEASPSMDEVKNKKFDDTVVKPYAKGEMRLPYAPSKKDIPSYAVEKIRQSFFLDIIEIARIG